MPNILGIANNLPLQPKLSNLFTLQLDNVPGQTNSNDSLVKLQINLIDCTRPTTSFNTVSMTRFNQKYSVAGAPNPEITLTAKFRDTIQGNVSRVLWNWSQVIYNPKTGQMGYANSYKTDGQLWILDPMGKRLETFFIKGIWPSKIEYGSALAYSDSPTASEVTLTMTYDIAWMDNSYNEVNPSARFTTDPTLSPNFAATASDVNFDANKQIKVEDTNKKI
jgi:hypothetical protein